jgi:hypothetical protein
MSEILRALLDAACIDSQPAFYSVQLNQLSTVTGVKTFQLQNAFIQCKPDTYFLMMSWYQDSAFERIGGPYLWTTKTEPTAFTIQDAKTGETFSSNGVVLKGLQNYNLNNSVILPEYHLWGPSDLIAISQTIQLTDTGTVFTHNSFVTLAGIEYKLPAGKDYQHGRAA